MVTPRHFALGWELYDAAGKVGVKTHKYEYGALVSFGLTVVPFYNGDTTCDIRTLCVRADMKSDRTR